VAPADGPQHAIEARHAVAPKAADRPSGQVVN
jgi:hypothetical protein